jgi:hypothetical protein
MHEELIEEEDDGQDVNKGPPEKKQKADSGIPPTVYAEDSTDTTMTYTTEKLARRWTPPTTKRQSKECTVGFDEMERNFKENLFKRNFSIVASRNHKSCAGDNQKGTNLVRHCAFY